ncbi:MAG: hydroxymethylglutaryl-CoA lyase [Clostridiaceae bacterium BRH_c20a]|nr:MAG: hydroxymethylglutaryl-CoA lyase [Clostridiaceae bacterium BRH_c20a]
MNIPKKADVIDVGCRDGFQLEKEFIPTEDKISIVKGLARLGFKKIEATSFVSPKAVPQMQDSKEVIEAVKGIDGVVFSALVPNLKGAERALSAGVGELNIVFSASETHNMKNLHMSVMDSLKNAEEIIALAGKISVNVTVATSFGCPFEGRVSESQVISLAEKVLSLGASGITFADTTGMANPIQVYRMMKAFVEKHLDLAVTLHFHNTRNMGLANIVAGLQAGVASFDASLGGLGGCPFAPGATGNVPTEDVVHMLHEMGVETGIDLGGLIDLGKYLEKLIGRSLPGQILKAGKSTDLYPCS